MSLERLLEHRRLWSAKPVLARVYEPWFAALLDAAPRGARVLEVGAGPGFLTEVARGRRPDLRWIASDLHPTPWNALAADAGRLPLAAASVDAVLGLDVLHHLGAPPTSSARRPASCAPGDGWLSSSPGSPRSPGWCTASSTRRTVASAVDPWRPFPADGKDSFDGDAAVPWRVVGETSAARWRDLGLSPPRVARQNAFAYLLTLGFRPRSLLPARLAGTVMALDRATRPLAPLTALRALVTWEKA